MSLIGGFDRDLEGFQIQGNLTVTPHGDISYGGNGSIEASGTLFVDCISNYSVSNTKGIGVHDNVFFQPNSVISLSDVPSTTSSTGSFVLYGGLSIDNSTDAASVSSGGSITTLGGVSVGKQLFVGGQSSFMDDVIVDDTLFVDNIINQSIDAVTIQNNFAFYSDKFISYSETPSTHSSSGSFLLYGGLSIHHSTDATSVSSGGSITTLGGASVAKQLYVGGQSTFFDDMSIQDSSLLLDPTSKLLIQNTEDATSLTTGGTLTTLGGAIISKKLFVGGDSDLAVSIDTNMHRITSVATPINGFDAVNKNYVNALFQSFSGDGGGSSSGECCNPDPNSPTNQSTFQLKESVTVPEDIPSFTFENSVYKSFLAHVYLNAVNDTKHSLFIIKGVLKGSTWVINTSFIGDPSGVDFYIRSTDTHGIMQYTNSNPIGPSFVLFRTLYFVEDDSASSSSQRTITLSPNVTSPQNTDLIFLKEVTLALRALAYVAVAGKYALFFFDTVYDGTQWVMHSHYIGDETNVRFFLESQSDSAYLQYTNTNSVEASVRWKDIRVSTELQDIELNTSVSSPQSISQIQFGTSNEKTKNYIILVQVPDSPKSALYFVDSVLDGTWKINTRLIGEPLGVHFSVQTVDNIGTLYYTNSNSTQTIIKYIASTPAPYSPPSVGSGGTGNISLLENAVLRGNGTDPILGTSDFIYEDYVLKLSPFSSILIENTSDSIHGSVGGTFTTYGGASIGKELFVDDVNLTPSNGDIFKEQTFAAQNNVITPENVNGFLFDYNTVRSFHALVSVEVYTDTEDLFACYDIHGINKETNWVINNRFIGDDTNIRFHVDSNSTLGQIKYTSSDFPNWDSSKIRFRALTTSKS
jgi:hypothetical protein